MQTNIFILLKNAIIALFRLPVVLFRVLRALWRADGSISTIMKNEVEHGIYILLPLLYVFIALVALSAFLISDVPFQWMIIGVCAITTVWAVFTILLGREVDHIATMMQASSLQYYLLFMGFIQTVLWVLFSDNPKNEPSSVLILFLASVVAYLNEKLVKPTLEFTNQQNI